MHPLDEAAKTAEQKEINEVVERQIKVLAGSFDKAAAYTNFIILAGYATFFGLWQLTNPLLSPKLAQLAALLISISAISFVMFEIYKTYHSSRSILRLDQLLLDPNNKRNYQTMLKAFDDHDDETRRMQRRLIPVWYVTFFTSVITGVFGGGILMFMFVCGLFG